MNPNINEINPDKIGQNVEKTTNYLKKLSNFIEKKLYDEEGNVKNSGVQSLSLTFAMLVGFSMAIIVLSSVFITFILISNSNTLDEKQKEIAKSQEETRIESVEKKYWEKRYSNVYSQCDSIGFSRARQALDFSNSINHEITLQKNKLNSNVKENSNELKELNKFNKEIKNLQEKIN